MSLFSNIKSIGRKIATATYNTVNSIGSALTKSKQPAAVAMAFPVTSPTAISSAVNAQKQKTAIQSAKVLGTGSTTAYPGLAGGIPYSNYQSLQTPLQGGDIQNAINTGQYGPSPIYSAPVNLRGGQSPSSELSPSAATIAASGYSSLNSSATSPSTAMAMPSSPTSANPGNINNGGLLSSLSTTHDYNPATNIFTEKPPVQPKETSLQDMLDMIPQKESVYQDPQVQQQQAEINARKTEVANYTAQLNNVVAQQNTDLLRLQGIGAKEGVTETVYGGQAAEINREAAIKALPIQAQIAAAQGSLQLAQDYLTQLTTWKKEQIDNQYTYRKDVFSMVKEYADAKEKRQLDLLNKENDRAYKSANDIEDKKYQLALEAAKNGQSGLISRITAINSTSPNAMQELATVAGGIRPKPSAGGTTTTDTGGYKFSSTQLNTGAATATLPLATFNSLDGEVKNFYINSKPIVSLFNEALTSIKDGSATKEKVKTNIQSMSIPDAVKQYLNSQVDTVPEPPKESFISGVWSGIKGLLGF